MYFKKIAQTLEKKELIKTLSVKEKNF